MSARVQYVTTTDAAEAFASSASNAHSLPGAATVGNQIVVIIAAQQNIALRTISSIADDGSTSFASRGTRASNANGMTVDIWSGQATSTSAGANVVVTASGDLSTHTCKIAVIEVSGVAANQASASTNHGETDPVGTTHTSNSATRGNASDFVLAARACTSGTYTEDADFTELTPTGGGGWTSDRFFFGEIANPSGNTAMDYTSADNELTAAMIVSLVGTASTAVPPFTSITVTG